ncbi:MAG: C4-dicarboxylate transporter DcuC [Capnocytophaga sp.]|nr:C4-dicarboxylate transporter DcuC [Capnocytophaga sp.]
MIYVGAIIAIQVIVMTAVLLYKKHNPQGVLIVVGLLMLSIASVIGMENVSTPHESTNATFFNIFKIVEESFTTNLANVGFMIMAIGGYVEYMKKIKASDALVHFSMRPLSLFKKYPYVAAVAIIPIGQLLSIAIPSATGLGLLLAASVLPVLVSLGVSRLSSASVITATTVFDIGPSSVNTAMASLLSDINSMSYFIDHQLALVIPGTLFMMLLYFITMRYFDKKEKTSQTAEIAITKSNEPLGVPLVYAIFPMLPLILLVLFSKHLQILGVSIELKTTTAMIVSMFVAMFFEFVRRRNLRYLFDAVTSFWEGMSSVFVSVVTLIVCAEIFSKGLISLGFIDFLIDTSLHLGFQGIFIGVLIMLIIFCAAILMGSGNASFFSFGPLVPDIAKSVGIKTVDFLLPMQLSASLGRAASPIAGVVIATAKIAGVSPFALAKRNLIPVVGTTLFLIIYHYFFNM